MCVCVQAWLISEAGMAGIPNQKGPNEGWDQHLIITCALQISEEPALPLDENEQLQRRCHKKCTHLHEKKKAGAGGSGCVQPTDTFPR